MIPKSDRDDLRREAERLGARRVLEFGPGHSTYAFLEAGCGVVTLEHDSYWRHKARRKFGNDKRVKIVPYVNKPTVLVPHGALGETPFDLAFVDSPQGVSKPGHVTHPGQEGLSRCNTMRFALGVAPVVLLHDAQRRGEQATLERLANEGFGIEQVSRRIARVLAPVGAHAAA